MIYAHRSAEMFKWYVISTGSLELKEKLPKVWSQTMLNSPI